MLDKKQCDAFLAVITTGSFDQAGQLLSITPSAVTLRVQALEKALGHLLLNRTKPCTLTQAGQQVFEYLQKSEQLQHNLLNDLMHKSSTDYYKVKIATNADSLATWLLPSLTNVLIQEKILIELTVDDQNHTYTLLEKGLVNACISTESKAMKGCQVEKIGSMRYRMLCTPKFKQKWFANGIHRDALRGVPAVIFNQKDLLHDEVLINIFGLAKGSYPYHLIPSSESFVAAIRLGLGYGMIPELQVKNLIATYELIDLFPEYYHEVQLYWHHWAQQPQALHYLTSYMMHCTKQVFMAQQ